MSVKIFNVRINGYTKIELLKKISGFLKSDKKIKIYKINTEFLHRALKDDQFKSVLNSSDINIADGRGVLWAARYLTLPIKQNHMKRLRAIGQMIKSGALIVFNPKFITYPIKEAIPGVEAFKLMLSAAVDSDSSVFLFGSPQAVLERAVIEIKKEFPKLKIAGSLNGYDFQKDPSINPVEIINKTDARLLFVSLGCPRQEYWINDNIEKLKNVRVAVGEGGTFDRIANPKQMAPRFINKIGLEWLWRMFINKNKTGSGSRAKRTWNAVPVFISQIVKWKIKHGQTEVKD